MWDLKTREQLQGFEDHFQPVYAIPDTPQVLASRCEFASSVRGALALSHATPSAAYQFMRPATDPAFKLRPPTASLLLVYQAN